MGSRDLTRAPDRWQRNGQNLMPTEGKVIYSNKKKK